MLQDRIYRTTTPEGKDFFFVVNETDTGLMVYIFNDEPSKHTTSDQATGSVQLHVEPGADADRVQCLLWDDKTDQEGNAMHIITLIEDTESVE